MPLLFDALKNQLENTWLVPEGGSYPGSVNESADHFATAVVTWFAAGQAAGIPCITAFARKSQLQTAAAGALAAQSAQAAGTQLAMAVATYMAGQVFSAGPATGSATFPAAASAAVSQMIATFSDVNGSVSQKAQQIAAACTTLAVSTIVIFPVPPGPTPAPVS
ncbi:MAG: hypothetical protein U0441_17560 [Polyangiaceae bacterium]